MTGPTRNRLPRVWVTLALLALGGFAVVAWLLARPDHVRQDQNPSPEAVCSENLPLLGALLVRDDRLTFEAGSGTEFR